MHNRLQCLRENEDTLSRCATANIVNHTILVLQSFSYTVITHFMHIRLQPVNVLYSCDVICTMCAELTYVCIYVHMIDLQHGPVYNVTVSNPITPADISGFDIIISWTVSNYRVW